MFLHLIKNDVESSGEFNMQTRKQPKSSAPGVQGGFCRCGESSGSHFSPSGGKGRRRRCFFTARGLPLKPAGGSQSSPFIPPSCSGRSLLQLHSQCFFLGYFACVKVKAERSIMKNVHEECSYLPSDPQTSAPSSSSITAAFLYLTTVCCDSLKAVNNLYLPGGMSHDDGLLT